ncbi:glucosyltransferase [Coemansia sp. RSA 1722]|nr:glucosyltransferase [Coemansia sp. RSA 1722]
MTSATLSFGAAFAVYAASSYAVLQRVNDVVAQPYMDEIFHIPQAQRYCDGDFGVWDPKLTTPPGLYLLSMLPVHVQRRVVSGAATSLCSVEYLRTTNWILGMALFWVLADLVSRLHPKRPVVSAATTLSLALFPVSFFLQHLYYTDTGSLLFVLGSYALSLRGRHFSAAFMGFVSLWFRQTNAVWVAFVGFAAALRMVPEEVQLSGSVLGLGRWAVRRSVRGTVAWLLMPYLVVSGLFVAFVVVNRGIVLGDKSHHEAGLHVPQMLYFFAYVVGSSMPLFAQMAGPLPWRSLVLALALGLTMAWAIGCCTIEHPFLLSDNRHYPFYVWKNVFRRHSLMRYLLLPLYGYAMTAVHHVLTAQTSMLWQLALLACTALVLVPSPLLEFRYFTVPYYLIRLHMRQPPRYTLAMEIMWFIMINSATIWVFLYRPFTWESEPGFLQRFMW